jgi:8-oxo-dGTP pyrophosphatase MutT (NUDIX family)
MRIDPRVGHATQGCTPLEPLDVTWPSGMRLRLTGHLGSWGPVPPDLLGSARCIVLTDRGIVTCRSPDGWHPWPGGRLEPHEDPRRTACREVFEETGHEVDPAGLRPVGLLHYRHVGGPPARPGPDFLQVVYAGRSRRGPAVATPWQDLDDWELESRDVAWDQLEDLGLTAVQWAFVRAARSAL